MDAPYGSPYRAVAFDLLTALVDSWSLWIDIAGDEAVGRSWRAESLRRVTTAGRYRDYGTIVGEATKAQGLPLLRRQHETLWERRREPCDRIQARRVSPRPAACGRP